MSDNLLKDLLNDERTIDLISEYIGDNLSDTHSAWYDRIVKEIGIIEPKHKDLISGSLSEMEIKSFYLGMDYILRLLGKEGIMEAE